MIMPAKKKETKSKEKKKITKKTPAKTKQTKRMAPPLQKKVKDFYIVGMGASAGGLEAFEKFFQNMSSDSGVAFVLVPHLDPTHVSIMPDLLKKYTKMEVLTVEDGVEVQPNSAYVIPPNKDLAVLNGNLQLIDPVDARGKRLPIDYFFRSLAQDLGERAICVILSGTGTDGTLGLKAIKGELGMAMVQDPDSAKYDGMPNSALQTGLVDYILPPEKIPE
jgi:two-component system CheB/CheR fusion protein